ncbi:MAG: 50S ribosomal protein L25 [Thermoguttaceae bacterium]|jgi:large subunit ribosomal protein L25
MAEIKKLAVEDRQEIGKRRNRRLRKAGKIPAVLYGHKKDVVSLSLSADEVTAVIRRGDRFVALTGAVNERVFIKECQWNTWGTEILHVDFARVSADERVRMTVPFRLRGEAPGVKDGGVVKQHIHSIEIECLPSDAPKTIDLNINDLQFNQIISLSEVELPEGVTVLDDLNTHVVECTEVIEVPEVEEVADTGEPEVIGREEEEEDSEK